MRERISIRIMRIVKKEINGFYLYEKSLYSLWIRVKF